MCDAVDKPVDIAFPRLVLNGDFGLNPRLPRSWARRASPHFPARRVLLGTRAHALGARLLLPRACRLECSTAAAPGPALAARLIPSVCKSASATLCRACEYKADNGGGQLGGTDRLLAQHPGGIAEAFLCKIVADGGDRSGDHLGELAHLPPVLAAV